MAVDPEIRQRLLELIYDVLPEDEAAELRRRIEAEPEVARAYVQAQATAGLLAEAARFATPKLELKRPAATAQSVPAVAASAMPLRDAARAKPPGRTADRLRKQRFRGMTWLVGTAAGILLMISLGGYYYHRSQLADIAADHLRLRVIGPSRLQPQVSGRYTIVTTSVTGNPVSAEVQFALHSSQGRQLMGHQERTGEDGRLDVVLPSDLALSDEVRLEIETVANGKRERVDTHVAVEPLRYLTYLASDKRLFRPGETVRYRSVTLAHFSLLAEPPMPIHYEILDPHGSVVPGSVVETTVRQGVGTGHAALPSDASDGQYTLVARSPEGWFAERRCPLDVRRPSSGPNAASELAQPTDKPSGEVQVSFYPEGGELVTGLENRVFFRATNAQGQPIEVRGTIFDSQNNTVAQAESVYEGMGAFSLVPRGDEKYRMKLTAPEGVAEEPPLPPVSNGEVLVTTGLGVFKAGQPLEFNVRAKTAEIPLVASAFCRGAAVGQQALVTQAGPNSVEIALDETVAGVIRLVLYDYRSSPPRAVADRLVYRRPAQRLRVNTDNSGPYQPGQPVNLAISVTDEAGRPQRAVLGVSVVDEAMLERLDAGSSSMVAYFLLKSQLDRDVNGADFYLSEEPKAAVALDMLLGTQAPQTAPSAREESPRLDRWAAAMAAGSPPAVFDNLTELQDRYRDSLASFRAHRTGRQNSLTMLSLFGGLGLVLFVAMLAIMNIRTGLKLWIPTLSAATACTVIAAILMDPERLQSMHGNTVAFASFSSAAAPPSELAAEAEGTSDLADMTGGAKAEGEVQSKMSGGYQDQAPAEAEGPADQAQEKASEPTSHGLPVQAEPAAAAPAAPQLAEQRAAEPSTAAPLAESVPEALPMRRGKPDPEEADTNRSAERAFSRSLGKAAGKAGAGFGATSQPDGFSADQPKSAPEALQRRGLREDSPAESYAGGESQAGQSNQPQHEQAAAPGVLYWNPLLKAGDDGHAEMELALPGEPGTYRIVVEAHGDGRLGSFEVSIPARSP